MNELLHIIFSYGSHRLRGLRCMDHFISRLKSVFSTPCDLCHPWLKLYTRISLGLSRMVIIICLLSIVNCFTACTKADVYYPPTEPDQGIVLIYPDMSKHTLPAMQYHFYNTDTDQDYIVRACDGSGNFEGILPVGTYRVIATNTTAANVEFKNMDSHETAVVRALSLDSRQHISRSTYSMLAQPDNVYSTVVEELTVTEHTTARHEPAPALLTKQLNLVFTLKDGLETEVVSMTGILPGIYPAVQLFTCEGTQIEESPGLAVSFGTDQTGNQRKARISLFGLCDPEHGNRYTNNLELTLTMSDGSTSSVILDLTETLSEMIEENEGTIPLEFSIPIEMTKTSIGVGGEVGGWIEEGEDNKETET